MEPGDMIEWVYKFSGELVHKDETLWSSVMERFVPVGSKMAHLLVLVNDETFSWLNEKGLFHARMDDVALSPAPSPVWAVVPRTRANPNLNKVY